MNTMTPNAGTLLWCAPEVIGGKKYTEKVDVYSFGIGSWFFLSNFICCLSNLRMIFHPVCWEIVNKYYTKTYRVPYWDRAGNQTVIELVSAATLPNIPIDCHPSLAQLIRKCCSYDPNERLTFNQILSFINNLNIASSRGALSIFFSTSDFLISDFFPSSLLPFSFSFRYRSDL